MIPGQGHDDAREREEAQGLLAPSSFQINDGSTEIKSNTVKKSASGEQSIAPCTTQLFWLLIWMVNNMAVTILNKSAFTKMDFKYPYALSTIHMAFNLVGSQVYFAISKTKQKQLETRQHKMAIFYFSLIFSLNIAIGNTSLSYVSVSFNQVCRAMVPVLVMGVSMLYYGKSFTSTRKWSVVPIVFGVAIAVWGDISYTVIGAAYTLFCVLLAALKSVVAGELLTGDLKLHEMDLLSKMCPYALVQIGLMCVLTGEAGQMFANWDEIMAEVMTPRVIFMGGVLSFTLNVSSFVANKVTSALTLSIGANVKQVLLIILSAIFFNEDIGYVHGLGILIVILGSFGYGYVSAHRL
jgi:drug/metabolite transporter (DMT)-like permease